MYTNRLAKHGQAVPGQQCVKRGSEIPETRVYTVSSLSTTATVRKSKNARAEITGSYGVLSALVLGSQSSQSEF
jgi:hypothetical protein